MYVTSPEIAPLMLPQFCAIDPILPFKSMNLIIITFLLIDLFLAFCMVYFMRFLHYDATLPCLCHDYSIVVSNYLVSLSL